MSRSEQGFSGAAGHQERLNGLDHLRAFAISYVLVYHYAVLFPHPQWLESIAGFGWTGVDLFFVLSGYLMGGQLLRQTVRGRQASIGEFYLKRFFRIVPAYWVVLGLYFFLPGFREFDALQPLWKFLTFTENLGLDVRKGHAFSHVWSLCVEEHFYLVLPVLLSVLVGRWNGQKTLGLAAGIVIAGMALRAYGWHAAAGDYRDWMAWVYYPTYTRLDGLLVGVCVAALQIFRPSLWGEFTRWWYGFLPLGLLLLYGAHLLTLKPNTLMASVFGFPLVALAYGCVLIAALAPRCFLYRVQLSLASTVATLSYSLYLTHKAAIHFSQDLLSKVDLLPDSTEVFVGSIAVSIVGAWLLHVSVERPFLALRTRVLTRRDRVLIPALSVTETSNG